MRISSTSLFILLSFIGVNLPSQFLSPAIANSCSAAQKWVTSDIANRLGGKVGQIFTYEVDNSPFRQKTGVYVVLAIRDISKQQAQANNRIYKNNQLLQSYAARIINQCSDVVQVSIGPAMTDDVRRFSYHGPNDIRQSKCAPFGRNPLPWGMISCL